MSKTLTLGFVAHVDAGKTSLTERLLFHTGVLDRIGSVDAGSTQTDSLALERRRGITIRSAVASFAIDDITVNLLDTPGHPDFIAEVERVLGVLDGAVLIVSAVEGVQPQTRILMRALQRLRLPTLIFVNKIDRGGARYHGLLEDIAQRLTPAILATGAVDGMGTRSAVFVPHCLSDPEYASTLLELLADGSDDLIRSYVEDEASVTGLRLQRELAGQVSHARVHPVLFGSAITGAGTDSLLAAIATFLPASEDSAQQPLSGTVFKVERGPGAEKVCYVRLFAGTLRVRDRVRVGGVEQKITAIAGFDRGAAMPCDSVVAGQIAKVRGLEKVRIGDAVGVAHRPDDAHSVQFAPPTLETVVGAVHTADRGRLHDALAQLAEQDPFIALRHDDIRGELAVSLYGEVQKEVLQATLADEYGVAVAFRETTTICIERPIGTGEAVEHIKTDRNPFLAGVGLRIEPAAVDAGVTFGLAVELGSMPLAFFNAIEETVHAALRQGLYGWQVTDCVVTLTHSAYWPRQSHAHGTFDKSMSSTAGDFRALTPLVLIAALRRAGVRVYEPMHHFVLDIPSDAYGAVLPVLGRLRALPGAPIPQGATYLLEGAIPAAQIHELRQRLPALTSGAGVLEAAFDHYQLVRGSPPQRPRPTR